jgi:thiosulfate/3-mercaptopyruvate sulfurtransferase
MYSLIVSAQTAVQHLNDPNWIFLDIQFDLMNPEAGRAAYAKTHIPNALFVDIETELSGPKTGKNGRHPLPSIENAQSLFTSLGVSKGKQVVVYDHSGNMFSARVWWMLRWLGFESVAVLDGGLAFWQKMGFPVSSGQVERPAIEQTKENFQFEPKAERLWLWQDVMSNIGKQPGIRHCLVDARAPERFSGEQEQMDPVAGHIPGANNYFWKNNLDPEGCFLPQALLREQFLSVVGQQMENGVVHQCGSGVSACHNVLAFELAGLGESALYAGSWSEWCADPSRPVSRGV